MNSRVYESIGELLNANEESDNVLVSLKRPWIGKVADNCCCKDQQRCKIGSPCLESDWSQAPAAVSSRSSTILLTENILPILAN